jgi:hypothetical protein
MAKIEVKAKITAGVHPKHGPIINGRTYTIEEHEYADQLFERPSPEWLAPWEREKPKPKTVSAKTDKKGE